MEKSKTWYIIRTPDGSCQIRSFEEQPLPDTQISWGPFASQEEAISRRVGLIRAGKCSPQ